MNGATILAYILMVIFATEVYGDLRRVSGVVYKSPPIIYAIDAIINVVLIIAIWIYLL